MTDSAPWIFLRGLTRDSHHWGGFSDAFQRAFPAAPIVMLDLPGNGVLHREASPASVAAMMACCRRELAVRKLAPPYHLLAISLGGMVAAAWAAAHAEELRACVLINTSMRPFSPVHWRLQPAVYGTILRLFAEHDERASEALILRMTSNNREHAREVLDDWAAWRRRYPVSPKNALRQLYAAARFRAPLQAPATRLLVLASAGDHLVDPRCSRRLAEAWDCPLFEHPHAGHDLPLDDGDWIVEQVQRWY
ncbi:alpha/beta fold hydrolase [Solimonas terrae]|uniref:Alpha/beta hydrolase n=1 Tax=Solimonas terrae TaxID=1396819 RepID=A0A6M2BSY0_9GAMM|nr:alpha/beta fold hydrolase [Solimonas terrae]NGY05129.1 alpha/beta hydrolase [Solimonas terrae]